MCESAFSTTVHCGSAESSNCFKNVWITGIACLACGGTPKFHEFRHGGGTTWQRKLPLGDLTGVRARNIAFAIASPYCPTWTRASSAIDFGHARSNVVCHFSGRMIDVGEPGNGFRQIAKYA